MTFNNSFELKKMMDSARTEFDSVSEQLSDIESRVGYHLGGKTRGGLVGAIFGTLVWAVVFLVAGFFLYQTVHPYAGLGFWLVSLLLAFFLLIGDFTQIGYYGAILKARDRVVQLKKRVEQGRNGLSSTLSELNNQKAKGWEMPLKAGTSVIEEAQNIERQMAGMESVRRGFIHKMKNTFFFILCVGVTVLGCYLLYDLGYTIIDGEIPDKTLRIIMLIATGVACVIEIFLARWIWSKTRRSVNNVTLFAMLLGPVAFAVLLLLVVLVVFLVQLVISLLGIIIAGAIVFSCCCGG